MLVGANGIANLKLSDFGFARLVSVAEKNIPQKKLSRMYTKNIGTGPFMAPEVAGMLAGDSWGEERVWYGDQPFKVINSVHGLSDRLSSAFRLMSSRSARYFTFALRVSLQ